MLLFAFVILVVLVDDVVDDECHEGEEEKSVHSLLLSVEPLGKLPNDDSGPKDERDDEEDCHVLSCDERDVDDRTGFAVALNVIEVTMLVSSHDGELVLILTAHAKGLCLVTGVLESEANLLFA